MVLGDTGADKAKDSVGKESPGGWLCPLAGGLGFYGVGFTFRVVSGQSLTQGPA